MIIKRNRFPSHKEHSVASFGFRRCSSTDSPLMESLGLTPPPMCTRLNASWKRCSGPRGCAPIGAPITTETSDTEHVATALRGCPGTGLPDTVQQTAVLQVLGVSGLGGPARLVVVVREL